MALTSLLYGSAATGLGLVSTVSFPGVGILVVLCAIAAVVFGVLGIASARKTHRGLTMAIVGTILGGVLVAMSLYLVALGA
jgi:hypothetical protein